MQNLLSDYRRFIGIGYFSFGCGLISFTICCLFSFGLSNSYFIRSFKLLIFITFQLKNTFNLSVCFLIYALFHVSIANAGS